MKRTRWYPAHIKPVRVGWYELLVRRFLTNQYWWDGAKWKIAPESKFALYDQMNFKWRGLTAPVEASK